MENVHWPFLIAAALLVAVLAFYLARKVWGLGVKVYKGDGSLSLRELREQRERGFEYFELTTNKGKVVLLHFDPPKKPGWCHIAYSDSPTVEGVYMFYAKLIGTEKTWDIYVDTLNKPSTKVTAFVKMLLFNVFCISRPLGEVRTLNKARDYVKAPPNAY